MGKRFKHRLILDRKRSRANRRVRLRERVVLPRSVDHAIDMAQCSASASNASGGATTAVTLMVLDHTDAFPQYPLHPKEVPLCKAEGGGL